MRVWAKLFTEVAGTAGDIFSHKSWPARGSRMCKLFIKPFSFLPSLLCLHFCSEMDPNSDEPTNRPLFPLARDHSHRRTPSLPNSVGTPHNSSAFDSPSNPLAPTKQKKQYQNGYETTPRALSFKPYALNNIGTPHRKAFDLSNTTRLKSLPTLDPSQWNALALNSQAIPIGTTLHSFQIQVANLALMRHTDAVVISPTGSGKSLCWTLPLLARKEGISLVVTPYTSLGLDGEISNDCDGISSLFIYSEQNTEEDLELVAKGESLVVYVCPEMLESSRFAQLSLITYAGLRPECTLVNRGNFREELSTIILPIAHPIDSFLDIAFILPLGCRESDLAKNRTLILCDDLELLTKMFWWAYQRAASMDVPTHAVDIIHSGLSAAHQEKCLEDFRTGKISILIGSSKVSTGMNFPGIRRVIQYKCKGLTITDFDQRRGRGGRSRGECAVGMIFVEPSMLTGEIMGQDPGMLKLVRSKTCAEAIIQEELEGPPWTRHHSFDCCNHCDPSLKPDTEYQWIVVNPSTQLKSQAKTTDIQRGTMLTQLLAWRLQHWKVYWRRDWPSYGPKNLISDSDLETRANRPTKLSSLEDVQKYTRIVHWSQLGQPLFEAIQSIYQNLNMFQEKTPEIMMEEPQQQQQQQQLRASKRKRDERLEIGEMIMDFSQ
ncbi:hypothetical protein K438DRAFT_1749598 [Mycena galopus ATCC 62051]|nr:hypothetical protein K438DRAFT_1749598 [Mycena galopus ATCC 62051]